MLVTARTLWLGATNTYVVAAEQGGFAVVIDAPPDPDGVADLLKENDLTPVALLITHGHVDHMGGARDVVARTGATAYVHPDDDYLSLDPAGQVRALFGLESDLLPPERFETLSHGQHLDLAGFGIDVIHTPGHTPGHCCFHLPGEGLLFSGDQLFAGAVGRWDLPGGSYDDLMESMRGRVLPLPEETEVLPGHGPPTTLARERRSNPFLQDL